ncbi:MAG TPA: hypothetical protein PKA39_02945, partial [Ignavibacteria bacterium]|nr:hypothetical protein [Ignavibacteria bacterium]
MTLIEEYKNNLISFDLQSFLKKYAGKSAMQVKKDFPAIYRVLSAQLELYPRAAGKLPEFTRAFCYLTRKSYEQSSSEALAAYMASLFSGDKVIDLAGGLGIDDIAFSKSFQNVVSVDLDHELNCLAEVNLARLNIGNITRLTAAAEEFILNELRADLIYIDADRRSSPSGKRSVTLHDSKPDILKMLDRLFEISPKVLLKLSPLVDITYLIRTLKWVKEIRVISLEGETKEITALMQRGSSSEPKVFAVDVSIDRLIRQFPPAPNAVSPPVWGRAGSFLLEPASCIIKAGLVGSYAKSHGISPPDKNSILLFSEHTPGDFMGRVFTIRSEMDFSKSAFTKYLAGNAITKA